MNTLKIGIGGHNLFKEDFDWMQLQIANAITSFAKITGENFIILQGVDITIGGGSINWTDGYVFMNGELCEMPAGSAAYPANNTFQIVSSNDVAGDQTYDDLTLQSTYNYRRAVILGNAGGTYLYSAAKRFKNWLITPETGWLSVGTILAGGSNWSPVNGGGSIAGFRKNPINELVMNGEVLVTSYASGTDSVICTLPYPPGKTLHFLCSGTIGGVRSVIHVDVNTSGQVLPQGLVNGNNVVIRLEQIRYPLDWTGII